MNNIHIFDTKKLQAIALVDHFIIMINELLQNQDQLNIALSGGNTPVHFFKALTDPKIRISWDNIHIFWVDERCVLPDDQESNYGMTKKYLLDKIDIPDNNIHRILGEAKPEGEVIRYSREIMRELIITNNWPVFDWILLGLGDDGHTASLFPESPLLAKTVTISAIALHPKTGQQRITLTLPVINQAKNITFLVSGPSKKEIIQRLLKSSRKHLDYPAALIKPVNGILEWYLDREAAAVLL